MAHDAKLRQYLESLLKSGLTTEWPIRAYASDDVNRIIARLQVLATDDYVNKLRVAGFTLLAYSGEPELGPQACGTCIYYNVNQNFCDLPELRIPVESRWSCRLWRM